MKTKDPVHIMIFRTVTKDWDSFLLFIFLRSFILNAETYIKCLEKVVQSSIKRVATRRPYIWLQNSVTCHTNRRIQPWSSENFCDHITSDIYCLTPPIAIPLIIMGWTQLSERLTKFLAIPKMKARITIVFTNSNKDTTRNTSLAFWLGHLAFMSDGVSKPMADSRPEGPNFDWATLGWASCFFVLDARLV